MKYEILTFPSVNDLSKILNSRQPVKWTIVRLPIEGNDNYNMTTLGIMVLEHLDKQA